MERMKSLNELQAFVQGVVGEAEKLKDKHTDVISIPVNYACIFAQSQDEYDETERLLMGWGEQVHETAMGFVYKIPPLVTSAGELTLLKLRKPDPTRPERGDADFTVRNYPGFKSKYLGQPGFSLMDRLEMQMIELVDSDFEVRAYFSHPTLANVLGLVG